MKKTTPFTIFIYSCGSFLRIVRGEHPLPDTLIKPRRYDSLSEALKNEHKPRIRNLLQHFPPDRFIERRLKARKSPIKVKPHRTLAEAIKSPLFLYAQRGYNSNHQEVVHIYHRSPANHTGLVLARSGPVDKVEKLLKKYKKPPMRGLDYQDRKPPKRVRSYALEEN